MNDDVGSYIFILCISLVIGFAMGFGCAHSVAQRDAVEHNAAHYDSKTGFLKWNDEK